LERRSVELKNKSGAKEKSFKFMLLNSKLALSAKINIQT